MKEEKPTNIIYLIGVFVLAKLFYSIFKDDSVNKEQTNSEGDREEDKIDFKSSIKTTKELGKNQFLHSADDFGKWKKV